ncbi:MAG: hypothetical protein ACTSQI_13485 [Candidatus Helarchaeota archaeon]
MIGYRLEIKQGASKVPQENSDADLSPDTCVFGEGKKEKVGIRARFKRFFQRFELKAGAPQNLLTAGLWQIGGTLLSSLFVWLLIMLVSREDVGIGAEGVGILNTANAFFLIFSVLIVGISKATSQAISEKFSDKKVAFENARNGTFIIIVIGIIIGISSIVSSFLIGNPFTFQNELSSTLFFIGIIMCFAGLRDGISANLAAVGEYDEIVKSQVAFQGSQLIAGVGLIIIIRAYLGSSFAGLILLVLVCGIIVQTVLLYRFLDRLWFNKQIFRFSKVNRKLFRIARQGIYFAITDIIPLGLLGATSTIILLFFTQQYTIAGAYSIVMGYSIGGLLATGFAWPIITTIAEAHGQNNTEKIHRYLHFIVKIFIYITFLILALNISLSRGILYIFHGQIYTTGATDVWLPFILVITACAIAGFEYIMNSVILGIGKGRPAGVYLGTLFLVSMGFVSLFLWLNPFLPQFNASIGLLMGTIVMLPLLPHHIKKHVGQGISWGIGIRSIIALICTIAIPVLLTWPPLEFIPMTNIWILILFAIIIVFLYPIFMVFFNAIGEDDLDLIEKKLVEYKLEKYLKSIVRFLRKINKISPFRT